MSSSLSRVLFRFRPTAVSSKIERSRSVAVDKSRRDRAQDHREAYVFSILRSSLSRSLSLSLFLSFSLGDRVSFAIREKRIHTAARSSWRNVPRRVDRTGSPVRSPERLIRSEKREGRASPRWARAAVRTFLRAKRRHGAARWCTAESAVNKLGERDPEEIGPPGTRRGVQRSREIAVANGGRARAVNSAVSRRGTAHFGGRQSAAAVRSQPRKTTNVLVARRRSAEFGGRDGQHGQGCDHGVHMQAVQQDEPFRDPHLRRGGREDEVGREDKRLPAYHGEHKRSAAKDRLLTLHRAVRGASRADGAVHVRPAEIEHGQ